MFFMERQLQDLRGIGKKMLEDFEMLGVRSVKQLKSCDADELYGADVRDQRGAPGPVRARYLSVRYRTGAQSESAGGAEGLVVLVAGAQGGCPQSQRFCSIAVFTSRSILSTASFVRFVPHHPVPTGDGRESVMLLASRSTPPPRTRANQ